MRHLYILRHADAAWPRNIEDRERPLAESGVVQAERLAEGMLRASHKPELILCSAAKRTRQTIRPIMEQWPDIPVLYQDEIYDASAGALLEIVKAVKNDCQSVLLTGHNPGIHGLVCFLAGKDDQESMERIRSGYKPGWLSILSCPCSEWRDLMPGENELQGLIDPR